MCGIFAFYGNEDSAKLESSFNLIKHRGPDSSLILKVAPQTFLGFHRLAIMDLSNRGMQPFHDPNTGDFLVCNGEIYNFRELRAELGLSNDDSVSDCEVILPLIQRLGFAQAIRRLDGEFAVIYYCGSENRFYAARDALGVRPLFIGVNDDGISLGIASEMKALHGLFPEVKVFPPAHVFKQGGKIERYTSLTALQTQKTRHISTVLQMIRQQLIRAIEKRLVSDAPLGFLLSGGVDSSLVCGVAAKFLDKKIETFSIGCHIDAIDLRYARKVADYIGSNHHEVTFTISEAIESIDEVVYTLESWDTTTIRASIGMYLVCKYIREKTNVRVLLTGEVADELFGYKYTDFAPSGPEFQRESVKRVEELHCFDVLRADRCISKHGIEARVPFSDSGFIQTVMAIDPELKMNRYGIGKYLLRQAFANDELIPMEILQREKAAFSDAVGHSVVDSIKLFVENQVTEGELKAAHTEFPFQTPQTKEALYYRRIFAKHYPDREKLIPEYWLPNPTWPGCKVVDPSARVLANYGASGH